MYDKKKMIHIHSYDKFRQECSYIQLLAFLILIFAQGCKRADPFEVAFRETDAKKGISAISKVNDQCLLAQIALIANNGSVREAALHKLTDQCQDSNLHH
jgi:hypothetical protein